MDVFLWMGRRWESILGKVDDWSRARVLTAIAADILY
jgi:hypothetical protein